MFAFDTDLTRQPPDGRVVEEQRLNQRLSKVNHEIMAADMSQLVRENGFQLRHRNAGDETHRQQHHGTQVSNDKWARGQRRMQDLHSSPYPESLRDSLQCSDDFVRRWTDANTPQSPQHAPAKQRT